MSSEDEGQPHLKLVVDPHHDEKRLARDRDYAEQKFRDALRKLAANVLRIVRGAGKPHAFPQDCLDVMAAFHRYEDAFGIYPSIEHISVYLKFELQEAGSPRWSEEVDAIEGMVRGALQLAAAHLLNQRPHLSTGRTELLEASARYQKLREAERASWRRPASKRRPKPKAPPIDL